MQIQGRLHMCNLQVHLQHSRSWHLLLASLLYVFVFRLFVNASQTVIQVGTTLSTRSAGVEPWYTGAARGMYNHGLSFDLSALSKTDFTHLGHPAFPGYGVRIKRTTFCDDTVKAYTGYIDVGVRHLFFYFFESRHDPDKDDVIFWTDGGPGASSARGLLMELGPCRIVNANSTRYHQESWNSNANIFFIDQPVGVGFSYADHGETVATTPEAAKDIAALISIFFENFNQFKGRPLHMAGVSYGGRFIPLFASEVFDRNVQLAEAGLTPINLSSIMIGNGLTEQLTMMLSYFDIVCTPASVPPSMDIATCVRMKQALPRCEKWMTKSCIKQFDAIDCNAAMNFCMQELRAPFLASGKNRYDMTKECREDTICYPEITYIQEYMNHPDVRALLGIDPSRNFTYLSQEVYDAYITSLDQIQSSHYYVTALLERNVRVLIYVGTYDFDCNWLGNERFTLGLEWSGQREFAVQPLREWEVEGKLAGRVRTAQGLMFATIQGGGHMTAHDKPKEALELVNRWMAGQDL